MKKNTPLAALVRSTVPAAGADGDAVAAAAADEEWKKRRARRSPRWREKKAKRVKRVKRQGGASFRPGKKGRAAAGATRP